MGTDNHRQEYNRGGQAVKATAEGHEYTAAASLLGFGVSQKTHYSSASSLTWNFGASGGATNKYDYLCWIKASDSSLVTAPGYIYAYSNNTSLGSL